MNALEFNIPSSAAEVVTAEQPSLAFTRTKTYTYDVNGKVKKVTRTWVNKGVNINKREQLTKFFTDNDEQLRAAAKSIKTLYNEYNDSQPDMLKISYSMFNKYFNSYFAK